MSQTPQPPMYGAELPPQKPFWRKSNPLLVGLASVAVVAALCLGCGRPLVKHARKAQEPPVQPAVASNVTVVAPETLDGRPRISDDDTDRDTEAFRRGVEWLSGADNSVGGLYGHRGAGDTVLMTASTGSIDDPKLAVDSMFNNLALTWKSGAKTVPPGPRGGTAKCRDSGDSSHQMAVCVWADPDAIGIIVFYDKPAKSLDAGFTEARAEIETSP
jgi:hypothetical protein